MKPVSMVRSAYSKLKRNVNNYFSGRSQSQHKLHDRSVFITAASYLRGQEKSLPQGSLGVVGHDGTNLEEIRKSLIISFSQSRLFVGLVCVLPCGIRRPLASKVSSTKCS